jgi:hypothetical protein
MIKQLVMFVSPEEAHELYNDVFFAKALPDLTEIKGNIPINMIGVYLDKKHLYWVILNV